MPVDKTLMRPDLNFKFIAVCVVGLSSRVFAPRYYIKDEKFGTFFLQTLRTLDHYLLSGIS